MGIFQLPPTKSIHKALAFPNAVTEDICPGYSAVRLDMKLSGWEIIFLPHEYTMVYSFSDLAIVHVCTHEYTNRFRVVYAFPFWVRRGSGYLCIYEMLLPTRFYEK